MGVGEHPRDVRQQAGAVERLDLLAKVAKAGSNPAGDGKPKLAVDLKKVTVS
ncbi:MAG: hypothetical protein ACXVGH_06225 [Mycobacteriales bacterium]